MNAKLLPVALVDSYPSSYPFPCSPSLAPVFISLQNLHLLRSVLSLHLSFPSPPSAPGTHQPHVESNLHRPQCVWAHSGGKLQAEKFIRRSGINYTIARPGGLRVYPPSGSLVMKPEDTLFGGSIPREQAAESCSGNSRLPREKHPGRPLAELLSSIKQC
ncbi:unnamed protein product [Spirodela intermedia]|uniref:NAD(P)-binding domain-containing protein n=1 Tax=Spirodela intermedia TaxID=51605 RepID=A0A7I8LHI4_SPIIN|nr:unnamed protein product [Spirodela intermedia]